MKHAALAVACASAALLGLGACAGRFGNVPAAKDSAVPAYGVEARLRALGSAVSGKVRIIERGDGIVILVSLINMPVDQYRVVLHRDPNCTSPNAFSAGPPWLPPGDARDPRELVRVLSTNADGTGEASIRVEGLHIAGPDGIAARSVVIYAGPRVTEPRPDVPNAAVACGTFEPVAPFQL